MIHIGKSLSSYKKNNFFNVVLNNAGVFRGGMKDELPLKRLLGSLLRPLSSRNNDIMCYFYFQVFGLLMMAIL